LAAQPERAGWSGYLDLTGSGWFRAREVAFRVTTKDEGVTLVVGNRVLLDCVGLATPPGTYNCGSNQDVSKKLWPGMRPITIEYAELSGDASFRLEWKIDPMSSMSQWEVVPASAVRTNLGLLTRTIRDAAFDPEVSRTIYAYADDDAKTRHLPSAITGKDSATAVERRTEYTYNPYGQTRSVTTAAGTALAATTRFDYVNDSTTSCLQQVTVPLSAADQAAQTGAVTTYACDEAGDVTEQTQIIRAVAGTEQLAQTRTTITS
jgi:YD repeat-containing protein